KTIMQNQGSALMGIGISSGENRAVEAAKKAISSPLLETSIVGAQGVLMNITGGESLSLFEAQEAADIVQDAADEDVNMIFGTVINTELEDENVITVSETGVNAKAVQRSADRPVENDTNVQSRGGGSNFSQASNYDSRDITEDDQFSQGRGGRDNRGQDEPDVPSFLKG